MSDAKEMDEQLSALAEHLAARRGAILAAWRKAVDRDPQLTTGASLPRTQMYDHIPCLRRSSADCERLRRQAATGGARTMRTRLRMAFNAGSKATTCATHAGMGPTPVVPGGRIGALCRGACGSRARRHVRRTPRMGSALRRRHQRERRPVHQERGEGIGLSIVKRLCELLDATMEMESERGEGTIIRIAFPRRYEDAQHVR